MEDPRGIESLLADAIEKADKYRWTEAAVSYQRVLQGFDPAKDTLRAAEVSEQLAKCYFNAAFQSSTRNEFRDRMILSERSEDKAAALFDTVRSEALAKRAKARSLFSEFWIQDKPENKRAALEQCLPLALESSQSFEVNGDRKNLARSLIDILIYREKLIHLSSDREHLLDQFEAALETGWRLIEDKDLADSKMLLETAHTITQLYFAADYVLEQPRYEELEKKLAQLKDEIPEISAKISTVSAEAVAAEALLILSGDLEGDIPKSLRIYEEGIPKAKILGDRFLIGRMNVAASAMTRWAALSEEYVEKRRELLETAVRLARDAVENLQPSSPGPWLKRAYGVLLDAWNYFALTVETDTDRKRKLLRKAIDETRPGIVFEQHSFVTGVGHQLSRAMYLLATLDTGPEEKARLLREALPIREEVVRTLGKLSPHSFSRGVSLNYLARIKSELSKLEKDETKKLQLLKDAASDMEECARLCTTLSGIAPPLPGQTRAWSQYSEWQGDVLRQLYETTAQTSTGLEAIEAYNRAITYLVKSASLAPVPLVRWKVAQTFDDMKEYRESSESFRKAAQEYRQAAKKIIPLTPVFENFANYMEAWAIIENARLSHEEEEYTASAGQYTKAAEVLKPLKDWSHLAGYYTACSYLELGEAMSRQERQQSAIEYFNRARANLDQTSKEIEDKLASSRTIEKPELNDWLQMARTRLKYALARLQLEEAKVLDARMEEEASSAKFKIASESFGKLQHETRDPSTRAELETLSVLCDAWAKMKSAEAGASPERYAEAAASFRLVEAKATAKKIRLAALANASMCKALESGSAFRRTRDPELYREIKKNLETATDFYEEAGQKKAADWTRATERFFDALIYLRDAEVETEPKQRAELFQQAENHMQLAATIYGDAGYPKKRQESLRHLERAKEEKNLLLTPLEALSEHPATTALVTPSFPLIEDRASGIERLEDAEIVARLTLPEGETSLGTQLACQLEIANIGKTPATLIRLEDVIPASFEVDKARTSYPIENSSLDMRGRILKHFDIHEIPLLLKPTRHGVFKISPRIVFADDKGTIRSIQLKPSEIRVAESDIFGWLRAERRLAAIMFTDMVGYTTLSQRDETLALELLTKHRNTLRTYLPMYNGKEIKTMGDAFLVEFASALDAVKCAIEIQRALNESNTIVDADKRVILRIGVHLGDVTHSRGDVYGDAVNVASRIEPLADPGGICISDQVYAQIKNKFEYPIIKLGTRQLKNVQDPMEVYGIRLPWLFENKPLTRKTEPAQPRSQ